MPAQGTLPDPSHDQIYKFIHELSVLIESLSEQIKDLNKRIEKLETNPNETPNTTNN